MTTYEYKVVPAPTRGRKGRGISGSEARFAFAIETMMNDMAADGWEYVRADTLPQEERQGLSGTQVTYRTLLVFRKVRDTAADAFRPRLLDAPPAAPQALPPAAPAREPASNPELDDNGVEGPRPVDALPPTLAARAAAFFAAKGASRGDDTASDDEMSDPDRGDVPQAPDLDAETNAATHRDSTGGDATEMAPDSASDRAADAATQATRRSLSAK